MRVRSQQRIRGSRQGFLGSLGEAEVPTRGLRLRHTRSFLECVVEQRDGPAGLIFADRQARQPGERSAHIGVVFGDRRFGGGKRAEPAQRELLGAAGLIELAHLEQHRCDVVL